MAQRNTKGFGAVGGFRTLLSEIGAPIKVCKVVVTHLFRALKGCWQLGRFVRALRRGSLDPSAQAFTALGWIAPEPYYFKWR